MHPVLRMRTPRPAGEERREKGGLATGIVFSLLGDPQSQMAGIVGFGSSFVVHGVVLSVLAIWVLDQFSEVRPLSTEWSQSEDETVSLPESLAGELEVASQNVQEANETPRIDTAILEGRENALDDALSDALLEYAVETEAKKTTAGNGFLTAPKGAKVVQKGSFSVWTVPEDPLPNQEYKIVIQVRLPKVVRRYRVRDLSGLVEGTDGYRQKIPWDPLWKGRPDVALTVRDGRLVALRKEGFLPIRNRISQLIIRVPPANKKLVRDTITIESRLLKEKQVLEIVF